MGDQAQRTVKVGPHPLESPASKLMQLFLDSGATEDRAKIICDALRFEMTIESIETFHTYFTSFSRAEWFTEMGDQTPSWKRDGPLFCAIEGAFQ